MIENMEHASTHSTTLLVQLEQGVLFLILPLLCGAIYLFLISFLQVYVGDHQNQDFCFRHMKFKVCCHPEVDELYGNVEQISTSKTGAFGSVVTAAHIQGGSLEQELEACLQKATACSKEWTKLQAELSESKLAELLKLEFEKSAGLEKEVKVYQNQAAVVLSDRDCLRLENKMHQSKEDGMLSKMTELQDSLKENTSEYTNEKKLCLAFQRDLEKAKAENEVYQKVVERFWKVRKQATKFCGTEQVQDIAAILLQDSEGSWSYGETNENLQEQAKQSKMKLAMVQEELQASSASLASLWAQFNEEKSARMRAEDEVFHCKERLSFVAEFVDSELKQLRLAKVHLREDIISFVKEEVHWFSSICNSLQHTLYKDEIATAMSKSIVVDKVLRVEMISGTHQQELGGTSKSVEDLNSSCNETLMEVDVAENAGSQEVSITSMDNVEDKGNPVTQSLTLSSDDSKEALAQALQEKVAALLLLSQQEERHVLEENAILALESEIADLKQLLLQVTSEKVNSLMELAWLHQECLKLQEQQKTYKQALQTQQTFPIIGLRSVEDHGTMSEVEKNSALIGSDSMTKAGYFKHLWRSGPELGSRSKSSSNILSLSRSKENETVAIARLRVENAFLRESLTSIRHLCNSANRLRLTISRVAAESSAQTDDESIEGAVEAVDGVISEALHLKVALYSSLPMNDLGWNSIGSPLARASGIGHEGSDGEGPDDLDVVSFVGLEIVRLVLLAAQLQKRFLGPSV